MAAIFPRENTICIVLFAPQAWLKRYFKTEGTGESALETGMQVPPAKDFPQQHPIIVSPLHCFDECLYVPAQ